MLDKVYEQSLNLVVKAAYYYYTSGLSQSEISELLGVSVPTVSRLLKKARDKRIVQFHIPEHFSNCISLESELKKELGLREVIISPNTRDITDTDIKKNVAMEGARYIQRLIKPEDVLGIAWGRTMYYLIHYLNPSQKIEASFVALHGSISDVVDDLDTQSLVSRVSMAFGGHRRVFYSKALGHSPNQLTEYWKSKSGNTILKAFSEITISISGVGALYPVWDSPLVNNEFFTKEIKETLQAHNACADIMTRFIDREGNECDTFLKQTTLGISLDTYKKIPTKIVVASGQFMANAIMAIVKGGLVDVLILDYDLATEVQKALNYGRGAAE